MPVQHELTPYPDPAVKVLDPRFAPYRLNNAAVDRPATGFRWTEGPVWFGDHHCLLFRDIPNDRIPRWDEASGAVGVYRQPSNNANGHPGPHRAAGLLRTPDPAGDPHRDRRVDHRADDRFEGKRLNAPNDVVVHSHGSVWFSDPGYGILSDYEGRRADFELPTAVYRLDPDTGAATAVVTDLQRPNGLCFSPDETSLSVVDSGSKPGIIAANARRQ